MTHLLRAFVVLPLLVAMATSQAAKAPPLTVGLVARVDAERAAVVETWLRAAGLRVQRFAAADCTPERLRLFDVVVVDWPKGAELPSPPPLGPLARWDRPTVLLGAAGDALVAAWHAEPAGEAPCILRVELEEVLTADEGAAARDRVLAAVQRVANGPGPAPDDAAVALAARIVAHHGGAALGDLATFRCWQRDNVILWDRREGILRLEGHAVIPPGARATPWKVSVFDTAADLQLIWGGNQHVKMGTRGLYRELLTMYFLPLLLLHPGAQLRLLPEHGDAHTAVLGVRLTCRGQDAAPEWLMFVDADSGALVATERHIAGRGPVRYRLLETTPCGPLLLPTRWLQEGTRNNREFAIEAPEFNPELPAGLATEREFLTTPRER